MAPAVLRSSTTWESLSEVLEGARMNTERVSFYYSDAPTVKQGMYFEDEDSRDSGIGDMECGPSNVKSYCGEHLFILDEEMEDMSLDENSSAQKIQKPSKTFTRKNRAFGDVITNVQETSPLSRRGGMYRTKSSMLPRKRTLPNIDYQPKRQKDEQENDESCQPSISNCVEKPQALRPRSFHRAYSTSTLEVSPHLHDDVPEARVVSYSLPTVPKSADSVAFRRIEAHTLCDLMSNLTEEEFLEKYVLIDCRYPYEYNGGHIKNAINMYDPSECEGFFFGNSSIPKRIPIFYCEYSQKRGPGMASALRGADRVKHVDCYPHLEFEEIYVLDKGYKGFFNNLALPQFESRAFCSPSNYVTMEDSNFTHILKTFNFHKRYSTAATCVKPDNQSRLQRQLSLDSPTARRPGVRRPLFNAPLSPAPSLAPQKLIFSPETPSS